MSAVDDMMAIVRAGRGRRPASLNDGEVEDVLAIVLALLVEMGVAFDRIDRLERALAAVDGQDLDKWKNAALGADAEATRDEARATLVCRALSILFDERKPTARTPHAGKGK